MGICGNFYQMFITSPTMYLTSPISDNLYLHTLLLPVCRPLASSASDAFTWISRPDSSDGSATFHHWDNLEFSASHTSMVVSRFLTPFRICYRFPELTCACDLSSESADSWPPSASAATLPWLKIGGLLAQPHCFLVHTHTRRHTCIYTNTKKH